MGTVSALLPTGPQCHTRTFALHPNRLMLPGGPLTMLPEELSTGDCVCVCGRGTACGVLRMAAAPLPTTVRKLISHNNWDTEA